VLDTILVVSRERFGFAIILSIGLGATAAMVAAAYDLPFRDPESAAGPTYVRLPAILLLAFLTDVIPRALSRSRRLTEFGSTFSAVTRERWPLEHVRFVLLGLGSWYLTYVAFRNLKSYVPFVRSDSMDGLLERIDHSLMFGHDPAVVLHHVLGVGIAAHVMSAVYIGWIVLVPVSLASALVWSRNTAAGSWFVTAVAVDWVLGVATYFAVPSVGPVYARPHLFSSLPATDTSRLQADMWAERLRVLHHPFTTDAVQTIAAFASLHVGITVTACVIAQMIGVKPLVRRALWTFLGLTVLATIYLGWHYLTDAVGGAVLGAVGAWVGAVATGNSVPGWRLSKPGVRGVAQPAS
jgi:PAP2 superfamily